MKFYDSYKAVFEAVRTVLDYVPSQEESPSRGIEALKTVILGEQFNFGELPKAVINAEASEIRPLEMEKRLEVSVAFTIIIVVQEYEPKDWFEDIIKIMSEVVDLILANRTLEGTLKDCIPVAFAPGEIKFQDKLLFGGVIRFRGVFWFEP